MSAAPGLGRWPLHPKPRDYETLEGYVRRLAEGYGARYESFCLHALGIPRRDRPRLGGFGNPRQTCYSACPTAPAFRSCAWNR